MRLIRFVPLVLAVAVLKAAAADEHLPMLKVGKEVYTNVTVTKVTAVDISFLHARGIANAKLKDLEPDMQSHFHYDPAKAQAAQMQRYEANAVYHEIAIAPQPTNPVAKRQIEDTRPNVRIEVPRVYARQYLGDPPPPLVIEKWLTPEPDIEGKFVLIDLWATWCGPCRASIPHLNELYARHQDRLVIIGISDEPEANVRAMTSPQIDYAVAIDPQQRLLREMQVQGIPHAILIDPHGIVRFEGMPQYLTEEGLQKLMDRYGD